MKKKSTYSGSLEKGSSDSPQTNYRQVRTKTVLFAFALLCSFFIKAQTTTPVPTATLQVPSSGSNSIPCGQVTELLDDGGATSNYSNNSDGYTVINAGINTQIVISGPYAVEPTYDTIFIYDGVGSGGTLLASYNLNPGNLNFYGMPGQTLTIRFKSDQSVNFFGFDLNVSFNNGCGTTPCAGTLPTNSIVPLFTNPVCRNSVAALELSPGYGPNYGVTVQWKYSTTGPGGPFVNVTNNSGTSIYTGPDTSVPGSDNYYTAVITCTNGNNSTQAVPTDVQVALATISTVPYYETFDEIVNNGDRPNCDWLFDPYLSTYVSPPSGYSVYGYNSQNFVGFGSTNYNSRPPANSTSNAYGNGIQLYAGVTYSTSLWYLNDFQVNDGIENYAISLGSVFQSTVGAVVVAQTPAGSGAYAPIYRALSDTFSVASDGIYYPIISITRDSYQYYSGFSTFDDFSIIAPCDLNSPTVAVSGPTAVCAGSPINLTATGANTYSWSDGSSSAAISITNPQAGLMNYMVVATNTLSSCSTTVTKSVNVLAGPVVAAFTSDADNGVCPGGSATLYAVGSASSYTWNTSVTAGANTTVSPTSNTTYTVIGSNSSNCTSSATITINALQAPAVGASSSKTLICAGEPVTLTGNDASLTYSWVANSVLLIGNPVIDMPQVATNYSVYGTDPSTGCSGTVLISVNVDKCLGINNISASNSGISVYPNPNNGEFTVELNNSTAATIHLVDVTGRILMTTTVSNGKANFNISTLANGVYYVKTQSSGKTDVLKVVKQ